MPHIAISLNAFALVGMLILAFLIGFFLRSSQLRSARKKILELESEMLRNHADILDLQKEKAVLEQKLKESKIPVIPLKSPKDDEGSQAEGGRKNR